MSSERPFRLTALAVATAGCLLLAGCSSSSSPQAGQTTPPGQAPTPVGGTAATSAKPSSGGGTTTGGTTTGGSVDPCSLLTQAEVDTAVGQPLGPGKATIPSYDCTWATTDFTASVSVTVSDWAAIKTSATSTGTSTAVAGVGDEALSKGGGLLYVRKGDQGFLLLIGGPKVDSLPDHGLAQEEVLAAAVFGRM